MEVMWGGGDEGIWVGKGKGCSGMGVIWKRAEMLWVWARHFSWWAKVGDGVCGALACKVICWPKLEKVIVSDV